MTLYHSITERKLMSSVLKKGILIDLESDLIKIVLTPL